MPLTKTEIRKLESLRRQAEKVEREARKLAKATGKELIKQMKKS